MERHLRGKQGMVVRTWSRDGWIERLIEEDEAKHFGGLRSRVSYDGDVDFKKPRSEMDMFQDVHNEIMYGPVGLHIDELPSSMRDMFQQPYEWHMAGNRLFRIVDPETQVYENGDWGNDRDEADLDVLEETTTTSRLFLEQAGILPPDAPTEEVTDILGSVTDGHEVPESPYGTRLDVDVQHVSIMPETPEGFILDNAEAEDLEVADYAITEDDVVMCRPKDGMMVALPTLPKEVIDRIHVIHDEFMKLFARATNLNEQELIKLKYEQALDMAVNKYLTLNLNSPYCAHRYSQPRRMHKFIPIPRESDISAAAEERLRFFHELFGEAGACESMDDLHGQLIMDDRFKVDGQLNPNYGRRHRPGGFMGKIRGMYNHDKELAQAWSVYDKVDKDGNILQRSAFNLAREAFIRDWRKNQKGDEESLRIAVWVWFDREAKDVPAVRDEVTGKLISPSRRYKDSIWRQKRTRALQDLFLTRKQWDGIYAMVGIVKRKLKLDKEPTKDRQEVLDQLAGYFRKINNLADLRAYMAWAQRRVITKQGKVFPSRIDRISFFDESRWRQSCTKKRKYLMGRLVLYNQLREQVSGDKPTQLEEVFLPCPDPECNCMAINHPTWFEIQDGKGLLGVRCDGCGKIVWCLEHKETPELKTYEEVTNGD